MKKCELCKYLICANDHVGIELCCGHKNNTYIEDLFDESLLGRKVKKFPNIDKIIKCNLFKKVKTFEMKSNKKVAIPYYIYENYLRRKKLDKK